MKKILYKNYEIIPGQSIISATINGIDIQGKVVYDLHGNLFFLQNRYGSPNVRIDYEGYSMAYGITFFPTNTGASVFGFCSGTSYSFVFNHVVGEDPIDYSNLDNPIYKEIKGKIVVDNLTGNSVGTCFHYRRFRLIYNKDTGVQPEEVSNVEICSGRSHPDCCGSFLYYGFEGNCSVDESNYSKLEKKDMKIIQDALIGDGGSAKLVHLSHKQKGAIDFVKKLGMDLMYEYNNNNSGNTIKVFHINPTKEG